MMFQAWIILLALWIRQLGIHNRAYREYEQCRREYEKNHRQPPEELCLIQERLRNAQENPGIVLKLLHRLGLILGQSDIEGDSGEAEILPVGICNKDKVGKLLNRPGRCRKEKLLHFGRVLMAKGDKCARFLRCHNDAGVKRPNDGPQPVGASRSFHNKQHRHSTIEQFATTPNLACCLPRPTGSPLPQHQHR